MHLEILSKITFSMYRHAACLWVHVVLCWILNRPHYKDKQLNGRENMLKEVRVVLEVSAIDLMRQHCCTFQQMIIQVRKTASTVLVTPQSGCLLDTQVYGTTW